jgi:metal-sulfur cluster biosynthetic enzyme
MTIIPSDPRYKDKLNIARALSTVNDPELDINVIDLGLIYNIEMDDTGQEIAVTMTLSTPSCPVGGIIRGNVESVIKELYPACNVAVNLTYEPKWSFDMINEAGRIALGW